MKRLMGMVVLLLMLIGSYVYLRRDVKKPLEDSTLPPSESVLGLRVDDCRGWEGNSNGGVYYVDGTDGIVGWAQNGDKSPVGCVDIYITRRNEDIGPSTTVCTWGNAPAGKTTTELEISDEAKARMADKEGSLFATNMDCLANLSDGDYDLQVAVGPNTFATPRKFWFSVRTVEAATNTKLWLHYLGVVLDNGTSNYESYPTVIKEEDGTYKMWYAAGVANPYWQGDFIFHAASNDGINWTLVRGSELGGAVLAPAVDYYCPVCIGDSGIRDGSCNSGLAKGDSQHTADPSVVKKGNTYYMYYTGASKKFACFGSNNHIFLATSTNGIDWTKKGEVIHPIREEYFCSDPYNCGIWCDTAPERCNPSTWEKGIGPYAHWYGAGQSSVILRDVDGDGETEFVHYYTDLTSGGWAMTLAVGDSETFSFDEPYGKQWLMGWIMWDMKYSEYLSKTVAFNALNVDVGSTGVPGWLLLSTSQDGKNNWRMIGESGVGETVFLTMDKLTADQDRWTIHNLGMTGDAGGVWQKRNTILYFGAGKGLQETGFTYTWSIAAVDVWATKMSIPGDANGDGKVDGVDYSIWFNNYNTSTTRGPEAGDFNNDGIVDGMDYSVWIANYSP